MGIITLALEGKDKASERALKQMRTEMNVLGEKKKKRMKKGRKSKRKSLINRINKVVMLVV